MNATPPNEPSTVQPAPAPEKEDGTILAPALILMMIPRNLKFRHQ
jgi:hypothetical protein